MNLDSTYAPPINNACVPDVYNRLDAEVIERTRVANRQLNMKLLLEQRIISKYRQEAERFMLLEKSRVARDLAQITQRLPDVLHVRDFDEKASEKNIRPVHIHEHHKKNYLSAKNEDPVCRRCYIHHLPTKKKFYQYSTAPQLPSIQDAKLNHNSGNNLHPKTIAKITPSNKNGAAENDDALILNDPDLEEEDVLNDLAKKSAGLLPSVEAFKFLERNKWGREIDLNQTLTPRLMPNEIWKNVVNNVCNQYSTQQSTTNFRHSQVNDLNHPGRAAERRAGGRSRRSSLAISEKTGDKTETHPRKLSKMNSRIALHRRPSAGN